MAELYILTAPNGKQYVGITKRTAKWRWNIHKRNARHNLNANSAIYSAMRKYGTEDWKIEILETGDMKYIVKREPEAILRHNTLTPNGYNISLPAGDGFGPKFKERMRTPEFKKNASKNAKKSWQNPEFRKKMAKRTVNKEASSRGGLAMKDRMHDIQIKIWQDPKYRKKAGKIRKDVWDRPGYREEMGCKIREGMAKAKARKENEKLRSDET